MEVFEKNGQRYGYRRIAYALQEKGIKINHKKVRRLMKMLGIRGKTRKNGKYHSYKGEVGTVADNLLSRDFHAENACEKLATDVTQFNVCTTKVYLSPIMDLYNNEIMSYSISLHPDLAQIREMLDGLSKKLPKDATPILHSDQGWQYQHAEYQRYLKEHNITQSMSRKGNCMDNGAMECFFGRLKVEMFYGEKFESVEDFMQKLREYISYWNNERISLKLKNFSQIKRNEPGWVPYSFPYNLIFFVQTLGVTSLRAAAFASLLFSDLFLFLGRREGEADLFVAGGQFVNKVVVQTLLDDDDQVIVPDAVKVHDQLVRAAEEVDGDNVLQRRPAPEKAQAHDERAVRQHIFRAQQHGDDEQPDADARHI